MSKDRLLLVLSQTLIVILLVAGGWVQYILWFGDNGLVRLNQIEEHNRQVTREVHKVELRISRLKEEIWLLENEPLFLEEAARRELGLVYPNELIFVFPESR